MPDEAPEVVRDHILCVFTWDGEEEDQPTDESLSLRRVAQQPTDHPNLLAAELRHARAQKHIRDIRENITRYIEDFDLSPEQVQVKAGVPHAMQPVALSKFRTPEATFGVLLGEAVYNLRAALDYLIYELAWLDSGKIQDGTQFPIEDNSERFEGRVTGFITRGNGCTEKRPCARYLAGVNPTHIEWVKQFQPCEGCEWTKTLRGLSNPDKHRRMLQLGNAIRVGWKRLGPKAETDTGLVMDVEFQYTPFISVDGIDLGHALAVLQEEVGNVLALFRPEFERLGS
jgi:hypothetical protein